MTKTICKTKITDTLKQENADLKAEINRLENENAVRRWDNPTEKTVLNREAILSALSQCDSGDRKRIKVHMISLYRTIERLAQRYNKLGGIK